LCCAIWSCWCMFPLDFECWSEFKLPGELKICVEDLKREHKYGENLWWCLRSPWILKLHASLHIHGELLSVNVELVLGHIETNVWQQRET
jgi:hypothetical protein